nr:MAG TPA: hypothetical protein [Caudoviricetes sp.]
MDSQEVFSNIWIFFRNSVISPVKGGNSYVGLQSAITLY